MSTKKIEKTFGNPKSNGDKEFATFYINEEKGTTVCTFTEVVQGKSHSVTVKTRVQPGEVFDEQIGCTVALHKANVVRTKMILEQLECARLMETKKLEHINKLISEQENNIYKNAQSVNPDLSRDEIVSRHLKWSINFNENEAESQEWLAARNNHFERRIKELQNRRHKNKKRNIRK